MPTPADLVYQTTSSTGTGNLTLTAVNGRRTFASAFTTGTTLNVFDYFICNNSASEFEIGTGHILVDGVTLVRDTVLRSTAGTTPTSFVNFGNGIKDVTNDIPAQYQVRTSTNTVVNNEVAVFDGTSGSLIKSAGSTLGTIAALNSPLPIANGGTGATSAVTALTNLGAQTSNATLTSLSGLTLANGTTLYATAANTLAALAAGTNGNVLKLVTGQPRWGSPFSINLQRFSTASTGTYTPSVGTIAALIFCTGGGGGGAGVNTLGTANKAVCGGGGGAGGTAIGFFSATTIGASQNFTVGAGGAGGANTGANGGAGANSGFGSLLTGNGGSAGNIPTVANQNQVYVGSGGAGGGTSVGAGITAVQLTGGSGSGGVCTISGTRNQNSAVSGGGGASFWGGAGGSVSVKDAGAAGTAYLAAGQAGFNGSGGGGAVIIGAQNTGASGGAGGAGLLAIFEFIAA